MDEKKRILTIDDEADIAILLKQVLEEASFEVDVASSGTQGLAIASSSHFDMILLDMKMPDMDGMSVMQHLREQESTRKTPVIFLTGSAMDVDLIVAALDLNPSDFITKVVSPKELIARIHWAFRKQHPS
jgi:two-component system OmpR family response regulator